MKEKAKPDVVKECGRIMYWNTLPKHINRECIRDFIACVVHGMAVGSIPGPEAGRLLYGAQVAQQALPAVRKWRKNSSKTSSKASAKCTQTAPKIPRTNPSKPKSSNHLAMNRVQKTPHPLPPGALADATGRPKAPSAHIDTNPGCPFAHSAKGWDSINPDTPPDTVPPIPTPSP